MKVVFRTWAPPPCHCDCFALVAQSTGARSQTWPYSVQFLPRELSERQYHPLWAVALPCQIRNRPMFRPLMDLESWNLPVRRARRCLTTLGTAFLARASCHSLPTLVRTRCAVEKMPSCCSFGEWADSSAPTWQVAYSPWQAISRGPLKLNLTYQVINKILLIWSWLESHLRWQWRCTAFYQTWFLLV